MVLRLPSPHDPLTLAEQAELDERLGFLLARTEPDIRLLRCELQNFARMAATLDFYRRILAETRDLVTLDRALPRRVVKNGIAYLEDPDDELYPKPAAVYCGDEGAPAQPHGAAAGTDASGGPSGATGVTPSHATSAEAGLDRSGSTGAIRETDGR